MSYFPIPFLVDKHVNHEEAFDVNIVTDPVCLYQGHHQGKITVKSLKVKPPLMICILNFSTSKIFFINISFSPRRSSFKFASLKYFMPKKIKDVDDNNSGTPDSELDSGKTFENIEI